MNSQEIGALLRSHPNVLLDFDGPVCAVFGGVGNHKVANELRKFLDHELPHEVDATPDPFVVLQHAAELGPDNAKKVERELRRLEVSAVEIAPATHGAIEVIKTLSAARQPVTIVSNNSAEAVAAYLGRHGLSRHVNSISARESSDPGLLKPNPHLLNEATAMLGAASSQCVMIGDSASDIKAARSVGAAVIAYANKPGKRERFAALDPDAIIDGMFELIN